MPPQAINLKLYQYVNNMLVDKIEGGLKVAFGEMAAIDTDRLQS